MTLAPDQILPVLVALPIVLAIALFLLPARARYLPAALAVLGHAILLPPLWRATIAGSFVDHAVGGWLPPLGIVLRADGFTVVMLSLCAVVMSVIMPYALAYMGPADGRARPSFLLWMLALWASLNALFLAGDIFNWYVTLELTTICAVSMVAASGNRGAWQAALRYLLLALAGSLLYLLGVSLVYASTGTLDWPTLAASDVIVDTRLRLAIGCMITGLALKAALFPLHIWLPSAHSNAPAPASAILSALVVKGGIYILLRLCLWVFPVVAVEAGDVLAICGAGAVLYGSLKALRQEKLKLLVAYSTVAQIGYIFMVFGLLQPASMTLALQASIYFMLAHGLAKSAMFLAVGILQRAAGTDSLSSLAGIGRQHPAAVFAFGLAGVSLMGLPPSGGFLAKWMMLLATVQARNWCLAIVLVIGGLLASAYVFRVLALAMGPGEPTLKPLMGLRVMSSCALLLAALAIGLGFWAEPIINLIGPAADAISAETVPLTGATP